MIPMKKWAFIKLWFVALGWGVYSFGVPYVHLWLKGVGLIAVDYWKHAPWRRRIEVNFIAN